MSRRHDDVHDDEGRVQDEHVRDDAAYDTTRVLHDPHVAAAPQAEPSPERSTVENGDGRVGVKVVVGSVVPLHVKVVGGSIVPLHAVRLQHGVGGCTRVERFPGRRESECLEPEASNT